MTTKIVYRFTVPEDSDRILEFLREHYYKEEPLTIACQPIEQDEHDEGANMSNIHKEHGCCVVALNGDQIVGAFLAGPKHRDECDVLLDEASHIPGTKWAKLLTFLAFLERESNIYERYQVDRAIHGHVLGVHKKFRGHGIGLKLFEKSMERAHQLGYPLYSSDCTSVYSARLCERLGMECVNECAFESYRAPGSNEQVFFPPAEHKLVKTYAKKLL